MNFRETVNRFSRKDFLCPGGEGWNPCIRCDAINIQGLYSSLLHPTMKFCNNLIKMGYHRAWPTARVRNTINSNEVGKLKRTYIMARETITLKLELQRVM